MWATNIGWHTVLMARLVGETGQVLVAEANPSVRKRREANLKLNIQKNELRASAAVMIIPIEWDEPFGIVFAEAAAYGTRVISCPRGALPENIRRSIDGFLTQSVADACVAFGKLPGQARQACREQAHLCSSAPVVVSKYELLYARNTGGKA
jgi:glycosyltransferase involved in cell wall biosynthesis